MSAALDLRAVVALVVLCGSWGLNQVAIKVALWGIPPALQMGGRSLVAAILVGVWCALRRIPLFSSDGTLWPGIAVGILFAVEFVLLFWGLEITSAGRGVLFLYLAPFVVAVGGHFFLGERLSGRKLMGLGCAFLGMALAFSDRLSLPSSQALVGDALCLAAAIFWGATIVMVKGSALARAPAEKTLLYQLGVSAALGFVLSPALGETLEPRLAFAVMPAFLYQAVWVAAITYVAWFALMRKYPASLLTSFTFLTPLFGVAFGAALLGEPVTPHLLAALLLVGAGIYLVNRSSAGQRRAAAA
ncbi:MAG: DMT family transporter [Rhizobiales bacterium]|nr:DMT family transporter [Hyphomicrobiales bacterium]